MYQFTLDLAPEQSLDPNIILIDDPRWDEALREWEQSKAYGYDCETYGESTSKKDTEALDWKRARLRLVQIGLMSGRSIIADFGGWLDDTALMWERNAEFIRIFKKLGPDKNVVKIGHNLAFDGPLALRFFDTPLRNVRDTMLMSQVYWAGVKDYHHGLKDVAERFGYEVDKSEQKSAWGQTLSNSQLNYAALDAQIVMKIAAKLKTLLVESNIWETAMIENNACPAFIEMMYYGLPVDEQKLDEILAGYEQAAEKSIVSFSKEFPGVLPTSAVQVKKAVNAKYGLDLKAINKQELAYVDQPWVQDYLTYKGLNTQIAYLKGIKKGLMNGRIRPSFFQIAGPDREKEQAGEEGKGMGRSSCKAPNLQNPSTPTKKWLELGLKSVREIFRAPAGYKFIINDLSQAHMRIAADASQDSVLVEAYNKKWCLHSLTASKLAVVQGLDGTEWTHFNIKKWDKDESHPNHAKAKSLRKVGKTQNYAALNGAGPEKIMINSAGNTKDPVFAPLEEWEAVGKAFKELYSGLESFRRRTFEEVNSREIVFNGKKFGWVVGHSGRRIFLEKSQEGKQYIKGQVHMRMQTKYTDTCSAIWLSCEADAAKISLAEWLDRRDAEGWDAHIVNFPHDEINVIAHESCALEAASALLEIMDNAMKKYITLIPVNDPIDPQTLICDSWAEK